MKESVDLVIRNARVLTPTRLFRGGIGVAEGKVVSLSSDANLPKADKVIDAKERIVIPGLVDEHVHMGDPYEGPYGKIATMREDFATGTMAAAAGGVTTVIEMPDSVPLVTSPDAARQKLKICAEKSYVDFGLHGGFLPGQQDYERSIRELYNLGLTAVKTYTCYSIPEWPPCYDGDLYYALIAIQKIGAIVLLHAENDFILSANEKRLKAQGRKDIRSHLEWRTPIAEIEADRRMAFFLKETGATGLILHTSVPEGVLAVKEARDEDHNEIYVETCPHFLFLTEDDVLSKGPWAKWAPPPRDKKRVAKMWELLNAGYIDNLGSDHGTYTKEEKMLGYHDIWAAGNGASSIEGTLPLMLDAIKKGKTTLEIFVRVACENPAKLLRLYPRKGCIQVGSDADFVIIDMGKEHKLSNDKTKSKSGWILYDGVITKGAPVMTIVRGDTVMEEGEIVGRRGYGRFVTRNDYNMIGR